MDAKPAISTRRTANREIKCFAWPESGFVSSNQIHANLEWVSKPKVFIAKAYGERGQFPYLVTAKPFLGFENSCCTETYLVVGPFDEESYAQNVKYYMESRFFRFLVLLKKNTQNPKCGESVGSIPEILDSGSDPSEQKCRENLA